MKLYHRTSEPLARRIMKEGFRPRGKSKSNWKICRLAQATSAWEAGLAERPGDQDALHQARKPLENGQIESFDHKLRDECLNRELFGNLHEARVILESWPVEYSERRPHSSLGYLTPSEYAGRQITNPGLVNLKVSSGHDPGAYLLIDGRSQSAASPIQRAMLCRQMNPLRFPKMASEPLSARRTQLPYAASVANTSASNT